MAYEDMANEASDFRGDVQEGINDMVVDVDEFSDNELESYGEEGREALENGDIDTAVDCSDMPEEEKEGTKEILGIFEVDTEKFKKGATKAAIGAAGMAIASTTPLLQPLAAPSAALAIEGGRELASAIQIKSANIAPASA